MATVEVEVGSMTFTKSFTSPTKPNKQVPNHLLETKIFSKVSENEVFQTCPSSIHFTGYEIKKTAKQILKLTNISSQCQRMHIIPPTTSYFKIKYVKKERLVPGFFMEIMVEFTPKDWRYYYDCIRIHCQSNDNLVVPIHAYPSLKLSDFPSKINFGAVPVGESAIRKISLESDVPVDFEFQLSLLQSLPAIKIEPKKGIIYGCSTLDINVTFSPTEFCTVHSKLQLLVSQFNTSPQICHITGSSAPGLKFKTLLDKSTGDVREHNGELKKATNAALDPVSIDPLYRSRLKKLGKPRTPPNDLKNEELVRNGIRFPKNLNNPSAVSYVLQQQPGKLKAKDIREAVKQKKDVQLSTKQLKETVFEYKVQQDVLEERQNQLRWCVKLGEDRILDGHKNKILDERALAEKEYKIMRGDPFTDVEFDRSCTNCSQRRIHRQANAITEHTARFDSFVNDDWTKRHRVLRRFIQAGRKVIVRLRVNEHLRCLSQHLSDWKDGKFTTDSTRTDYSKSVEHRIISTPFQINPDMVSSFSFPVYKNQDDKEDGITNSLGQLSVESTVVEVDPYIPYFNLKVPQHYSLLGYKPHTSRTSAIPHVPRHSVRPLRSGAEDEVINLVSKLPHTNISNADILEIPSIDEDDEGHETVDNVMTETRQLLEDYEEQREDVTTATGKSRLIIPTLFFKQPKYHPLQIFNPSPDLHILQPQVSYSKVDEDYHLCPLPRYKLTNKSGTNKPTKAFIERPDVISGLMSWKRFPCQSLVSSGSIPNLTDVWVPRWASPFIDDLLPNETPELLQELPEDDEMSDTESLDDDVTDNAGNPAVLSPAIVNAMFPLVKSSGTQGDQSNETFPRNGKLPSSNNPISSHGLIPRNARENELRTYVKTYDDRLGSLVGQKVQEMNSLLKDEHLKML